MTAAQSPTASPAAGAADPAQLQALLVDIFALTGQKVELDDPLVAAALIHSALLQRAGLQAAQTIDKAAQKARDNLQSSAEQLHQSANALQQGLPSTSARGLAMSVTGLALLCLTSSTLGAALALAVHHWIG